ncbi:MAG: nitric oxide reductase activation protein NorD [Desulfocapsaceae bacterium]
MDKEALKSKFYELVSPSHPNEWEVDGIVEKIAELPASARELLFSQIPVIWPVSNSLCLSFLEDGSQVIETIPSDLIPKWVRAILRRYEQKGLSSARGVIVDAGQLFLTPLRKRNLVRFEDVRKRMLFYLRGVSGEDLEISLDASPHTNTSTFFVPPSISLLDSYQKNQLLYKFLLTLHWGFYLLGTFKIRLETESSENQATDLGSEVSIPPSSIADFLSGFYHSELAADIFFLLETGRVMRWLRADLPGLANEFIKLKVDLEGALHRPVHDLTGSKLTELGNSILFDQEFPPWITQQLDLPDLLSTSTRGLVEILKELYGLLAGTEESYQRPPLLELLGRHDFTKASVEIESKRLEMKKTFILHLQALRDKNLASLPQPTSPGADNDADQTVAVITETKADSSPSQLQQILDNPEVDVPEELVNIINLIKEDQGHIPPSYFSAASGVSGAGFSRQESSADVKGEGLGGQEGILLDEWDYRRNGYRKNWCQIQEREMSLLHSTFVDTALDKHRGLLLKLRRQFEFMKTNEHFVRRQREGDDIDLDAIVEARGDQRAGISPSSKLFVRLQRNERDIATIFLVDMSNSTEGWVGTVIKEALVLLCEVMDVAGDPYGILGFSGMRRSRCDIYRIKDIEEPYNREIHQRINSIMPREYTRMGPALRYASDKLKHYEARTRLLVTITDGKPEDYDDYKGDYAIEDTRKALMEARGIGIHTFCITVDREAHDYLPQMFGRGNYIFIDEIDKLPMRMIDMYRQLTS